MKHVPFGGSALVLALATSCAGVTREGLTAHMPAAPAAMVVVVAAASEPPPPSAPRELPSPAPARPTWSELFAAYMAPGTEGGCGRAGRCHAAQMSDAASAYDWLRQRGYIEGARSALASNANSCLRWFGGNMPPGGQPNPKAAADLTAWVAVGAPED